MQNTRKVTVRLSDSYTAGKTDLKKEIRLLRRMWLIHSDQVELGVIDDFNPFITIFHVLLSVDDALEGGESC